MYGSIEWGKLQRQVLKYIYAVLCLVLKKIVIVARKILQEILRNIAKFMLAA
jgi:hypothetical protein